MGFLNSDSLPYLVEKLTDGANIKIVGNNKGDRVSTVVSKISEKAKDVTKATFQKVTNTSTTFRTGTGNVDVSATMEDGFSNIGIRGKTYQNLVDSYRVHYNVYSHTCNFKNGMVKPNTTYTAVIINTCNQDLALYWNEYTFRYKEIKSVPINSYFITSNVSKEEVSDSTLFKNLKIHSTDFDYSYKVILLEGDLVEELTNNTLSYFEGMKSVGEPTSDDKYEIDVVSTGKNLLNLRDLKVSTKTNTKFENLTSNSLKVITTSANTDKWSSVRFDGYNYEEGKTYRIIAKCIKSDNSNTPFISVRKKSTNNSTSLKDMYFDSNGNLNTTFEANDISTRIEFFAGNNKGTLADTSVVFKDILLLKEPTSNYNYESYKSNKTKILLDEPLRKIKNSVYDELLEDGTLIRRCGEVVLDGSENWKAYSGTDSNGKTWKRFGILLPDVVNTYHLDSSKSICDSLLYDYNDDKQDSKYTLSYKNLYIYKHSFDGNVTKFKQWLNANPITLVYKLDTPIITKLTPLQVRLYKQGYLSLNTIPTESTHTVLLNKSAQIENSVEEVKSLDKRVENLEGICDDVILDTSRKFSLLEFDYNFTKTMMEDE